MPGAIAFPGEHDIVLKFVGAAADDDELARFKHDLHIVCRRGDVDLLADAVGVDPAVSPRRKPLIRSANFARYRQKSASCASVKTASDSRV